MRILVTGATSLLGRHVVTQLLARGDEVTTFQRRPSGLPCGEACGDLRDRAGVRRAVHAHDAVVHVAALVTPRPRRSDAMAVNVVGTRNVLDAAAAAGVSRFVHVSSPSVADSVQPVFGIVAGDATYQGPDRYTATKAIAEAEVLSRGEAPTVVIRPHLVWGPGDEQLVGRILARARSGRLVLPGGGTGLVDATYVTDAAAAIVAGLDAAVPGSPAVGSAWTVSGGDPRPTRELVEGILAAHGVEVVVRSVPASVAHAVGWALERCWIGEEPPITRFAAHQLASAHWFDQRQTRAALDWYPTVTVEEGMARLRAAAGLA
jgi:nucleoside-diphosphate-sugar epimerase